MPPFKINRSVQTHKACTKAAEEADEVGFSRLLQHFCKQYQHVTNIADFLVKAEPKTKLLPIRVAGRPGQHW